MCMLFLFMIYYKCIFIRFHEDKYSMDFFKKKNIKKLKIINNKTINIIYAVLLFIKMNLTDEQKRGFRFIQRLHGTQRSGLPKKQHI